MGDEVARIGLITDVQYADKDTAMGRVYRDADDKLTDAVTVFNADESIDAVIHLGDFVDGYGGEDQEQFLIDLAVVEGIYDNLTANRYYVFGNHDLTDVTKAEFISNTGMTNFYYYVDIGDNVRMIVLDSCYDADDDDASYANNAYAYEDVYINPAQRTWLSGTALDTSRICIVFCHHSLSDQLNNGTTVRNAQAVWNILETSGVVYHVFCGHVHDRSHISKAQIVYHEIEAMVDGAYPTTAYAILKVYDSGWIEVDGTGNQNDYSEYPVRCS